MGLIQTILGDKLRVYFKDFDNQGTVFAIDASMRESHKRESPASQFPIESGEIISENVTLKPFRLELHGIISDTPLDLGNALLTTAISVATPPVGVIGAGAAGLVGSSLISAISGSQSPSKKAFAQLLKLQEDRNPFTVVTSLKSYTNMWIESIEVPRDPQTGRVIEFQLSLIQLLLVAPQSVITQIFQNPNLAASQADAGRQQTNKIPAEFKAGEKASTADVKSLARNLGG